MTEEIKENCKFQQNYNIYGLDDKPCCYLYHKYCGEIDSCYFKRCKQLEQENKELKETVKDLNQSIQNCNIQRTKMYKALEEIRATLNKECGIISNAKAVGIINEVLGNEGN